MMFTTLEAVSGTAGASIVCPAAYALHEFAQSAFVLIPKRVRVEMAGFPDLPCAS